MKRAYFSALILSAAVTGMAQEQTAQTPSVQSQQPTQAAAPAPAPAPAPDASQDKSRVADFADKQAAIFLLDEGANKETALTLKSVTPKEFIFGYTDGRAGELNVAKDSTTFRFAVHYDEDYQRARSAYNKGDFNEALVYIRPKAYPLAPFGVFPEGVFPTGSNMLDFFVQILLDSGRLNEAFAFVDSWPLNNLTPELSAVALRVADALALQNRAAESLKIVDRLNFSDAYAQNLPDLMEVLFKLRQKGHIKECLLWYTKLSNMEKLTNKDEAILWMVYCDLLAGNKTSAEIYLSKFDNLSRDSQVFSLARMVRGIMKTLEKKPAEALDSYGEGIVFGNVGNSWMPEMLYRTGMLYKADKKFVASNAIFDQIISLYPDSEFSAKGKKEIVVVKEAPKVQKEKDDEEEE